MNQGAGPETPQLANEFEALLWSLQFDGRILLEPCRGCGELKAVTDVFDGNLCGRCRIHRGLARAEERLEDEET